MDTHTQSPLGAAQRTAVPQTIRRRAAGLCSLARRVVAAARWYHIALTGVLLLSAFLGLFRLGREGYSNLYYAATVKSMLTSWHNFFFASYDPGGFVSVDKPPLGLWIQAIIAKLFGFNGFSLLLPQVVAGVLSVLILYHLVRRAFGPVAGLLAALALAVAPINVATNRNNTMDSLLVLALLVGAWAVLRAAETGRLRWLLLSMFMVGLGFNIKMLQAYLVLPAFYLLYLVAAPVRCWRRLLHLSLAAVVLLAVSLSWAVAVDLTPPEQRPYVGGSRDNSVLDLMLGYNGLNRLSGKLGAIQQAPAVGQSPVPQPGIGAVQARKDAQPGGGAPQVTGGAGQGAGVGSIGGENGQPGPLRLLNEQLAGQIGWLLSLAVLGLLVAGWQTRPRLRLERRHQSLLLWGMWLLTQAVFFSLAGFWHRYYLVVLSPAIAALVGAGVTALWSDFRRRRWRGWLLPVALLAAAAVQVYILSDYPDWSRRLTPAIIGLSLVGSVGLVIARLMSHLRARSWSVAAATVGVLALLVAPTAWSAMTVWNAPGDMLPLAGPRTAENPPFPGGGGQAVKVVGNNPSGDSQADSKLVSYLRANRGRAKFLVATLSAGEASPIILTTSEPVMALGGFGSDQILSTEQLADLVARGVVRFFLMPSTPDGQSALQGIGLPGGHEGWVQQHCKPVSPTLWRSDLSLPAGAGQVGGLNGYTLYDCGSEGR